MDTVLPKELTERLHTLAEEVRELLPGCSGSVQINLARDVKLKPKVSLNLADVTEVRK